MRIFCIAIGAAAALVAGPSVAQTGAQPAPEIVDMKPNQPGGLVMITNAPWNDWGDQRPVGSVAGVADGRLEVFTVSMLDPVTGAAMTRRVISNTPIPDSIESRSRFGGPTSMAGKATTPRPGPVNNPRRAMR